MKGKSGYLHRLICNGGVIPKLSRIYGVSCLLEGGEGGHGCDVGIFSGNQRRIAVEISVTTMPEHERDQVMRDLNNGWNRVIVIAVFTSEKKDGVTIVDEKRSSEKKKRIAELVGNNPRVSVYTLAEFVKEKIHV